MEKLTICLREKEKYCKRLGCSLRMLDLILSGKNGPSRKMCSKLESVFGIQKEAWMWPWKPWPNPYIGKKNYASK